MVLLQLTVLILGATGPLTTTPTTTSQPAENLPLLAMQESGETWDRLRAAVTDIHEGRLNKAATQLAVLSRCVDSGVATRAACWRRILARPDDREAIAQASDERVYRAIGRRFAGRAAQAIKARTLPECVSAGQYVSAIRGLDKAEEWAAMASLLVPRQAKPIASEINRRQRKLVAREAVRASKDVRARVEMLRGLMGELGLSRSGDGVYYPIDQVQKYNRLLSQLPAAMSYAKKVADRHLLYIREVQGSDESVAGLRIRFQAESIRHLLDSLDEVARSELPGPVKITKGRHGGRWGRRPDGPRGRAMVKRDGGRGARLSGAELRRSRERDRKAEQTFVEQRERARRALERVRERRDQPK